MTTRSAVVALLAGAYLATVGETWGRLWVVLPLTIMVVLLGVIGGYLTPQERRLAELAERGDRSTHDLLARSVTRVAGGCAALVVVAVVVMVVKPSG